MFQWNASDVNQIGIFIFLVKIYLKGFRQVPCCTAYKRGLAGKLYKSRSKATAELERQKREQNRDYASSNTSNLFLKKSGGGLRSLFEEKEAAGGGSTLLFMVSARTLGYLWGLLAKKAPASINRVVIYIKRLKND